MYDCDNSSTEWNIAVEPKRKEVMQLVYQHSRIGMVYIAKSMFECFAKCSIE